MTVTTLARGLLFPSTCDHSCCGAPGRTRTGSLLFRRQLLCPLSYRGGLGAGYRNGCGPHPSVRATTCAALRWENEQAPGLPGLGVEDGGGAGGNAGGEVDRGQGAGGGGVDEAAGGHRHPAHGGPVAAVGGAAGGEGVGADHAALRGEPAVVEAGVAGQGVVEAAVPEEHAGDAADGELGAGEAVEGDRGGEAGGGAVEVADGHGAVGVAGVEAAADHEGAADGRPVDAGGDGRGGAEGGAREGPPGHGVVGADAEQVAGEGADPGLGDRDAAGQGHEGDLGVVLVAADAVGVAADPQALGGGHEREGANAAVAARVPGQGQAVDRVEGGDALAGDRARAGLVGGEAVVHPPLVAADVDRGPGDGHAVEGVAAGVVDPGRLLAGPRGPQLPARGGVAQAAGPVGAGGPDHEVAAVGRDVDIAHVGVEHRGALLLEAGGCPVGDADRGGGQVEDDDLVALQAGHVRPVADGDQPGAVGADVEVVDVDGAGAGTGEGQVDVVAQGPGDRVDGGQGGAGHAVDG